MAKYPIRLILVIAALSAGVLAILLTRVGRPAQSAVQAEVLTHICERGSLVAMGLSPSAPLVAASFSYSDLGDPARRSHFILVWNYRTGREVARFAEGGQVNAIRFSPDGHLLASGGEFGTVRLRVTDSWAAHAAFRTHISHLGTLAFSPDGEFLAVGGIDPSAAIWGLKPVAPLAQLDGHELGVRQVLFTPKGDMLITLGSLGPIHGWLPPGWDKSLTLADGPMANDKAVGFLAAVAPDSRSFATAGAGRVVRIWGVGDKAQRTSFPPTRLDPTALAYSPDGRLLAIGLSDTYHLPGQVQVWDVATGNRVATYATRPGFVNGVEFADSGALLIVGTDAGMNSCVEVWQLHTRSQ